MSQAKSEATSNRLLRWITIMATILVIVLLATTMMLRAISAVTPATSTDLAADAILDRAQDAVSGVELVLSFLEGASVLIGLGFGAATIYGLRSTQETREELSAEVAKIEEIREEITSQLNSLEAYRPYLEQLTELRQELEDSQRSLGRTINNVARLLQADQEFRLKNYDTAYAFAQQVLHEEPKNPMALYIAGWLEVQHLRDRLDQGIDHLHQVARIESDWPTAKAAYGVGLRRKARAASGEERERLFLEAEGVLKEALAKSPRLMDFESESYWGPVGGILRELGQIEGAINAYENALQITPGSSYPWGALATLYLRQASTMNNPALLEKALDAFERTLQAARSELANNPNNYYLLMDIAQSMTMLGQRNPNRFEQAHGYLKEALAAEVSLNSLETSQRGWQDMLDSCPEDWSTVRVEIQRALHTIKRHIAETS